MGNVLTRLFNRFVCSRTRSDADDARDDYTPEWGQPEYDEAEFNNEYSDDDLLLTDDDSWSGMDSFLTTDDSSDEEGGVTEGVGDKSLEEAEPEAEVVEREEDQLDQNGNEGREMDIPVREGGRCLVVERQILHGIHENLPGGKVACICGVICASSKNHRRHVEYASGNGKFGCAYCPKVFMYSGYLKQHQRQAHDVLPHQDQDEKKYACRDCTLEFCSMSRLLLHRRTQHSNPGRFNNCEQSAESDNSGEQPMRPDSSTGGQKRKLSAQSAKEQGPRKRQRTLPETQQVEEEPSSSNQCDPPRPVEPEAKRTCKFCNKNLRHWNRDFIMKNWEQFDFCCHETVHAWMMNN